MSNDIGFSLEGSEYIELKNLLKVTGLCETGGEAKSVIEEGLVSVDGVVDKRKALKVKSGQVVEFQANKVLVSP